MKYSHRHNLNAKKQDKCICQRQQATSFPNPSMQDHILPNHKLITKPNSSLFINWKTHHHKITWQYQTLLIQNLFIKSHLFFFLENGMIQCSPENFMLCLSTVSLDCSPHISLNKKEKIQLCNKSQLMALVPNNFSLTLLTNTVASYYRSQCLSYLTCLTLFSWPRF